MSTALSRPPCSAAGSKRLPIGSDENAGTYIVGTTTREQRCQARQSWSVRDLQLGKAPKVQQLHLLISILHMENLHYSVNQYYVYTDTNCLVNNTGGRICQYCYDDCTIQCMEISVEALISNLTALTGCQFKNC